MKLSHLILLMSVFVFSADSFADPSWENQGNFHLLAKTKGNFAGSGAGSNKLPNKYLAYDGINFLVKGPDNWPDYGRLNIGNGHFFAVPISPGMKVNEIHLLATGSYGNSYKSDRILNLYGENYFYGVLNVTFVYQDGGYQILSAPVFWDWFHLPSITWSRNGVSVKPVGINPVRPNCTLYHISFINPRPAEAVKDILISDSWLEEQPFSDIFALTIN
jgi:hypothetical protein